MAIVIIWKPGREKDLIYACHFSGFICTTNLFTEREDISLSIMVRVGVTMTQLRYIEDGKIDLGEVGEYKD